MDHKTVSLADQVFEHLETDILSGKYQRGDILTENHLCEILGVSRTPIREALRRLQQEHLIVETGKGSQVLGISEDDLRDIYIIREQLEGLAAKMAAENASAEDINELKSALELQEFYLAKQNSEQIRLMDNRFHEILYKISGSHVFYNTLLPLHKKVQKYRKVSLQSQSRANESVAEHREILNAIINHDAAAAEAFTAQHVKNAYEHISGKD
ncbi:MAG: GntR family transcriptional regulator [Clostridia bacterium]|nr:GntR family transcriptional regulator [Clostridia bacterium]